METPNTDRPRSETSNGTTRTLTGARGLERCCHLLDRSVQTYADPDNSIWGFSHPTTRQINV
ncbi:unnamed protein product [Tetraodon nigroviridis]|uniref:(spotted green pufferfish) hypothetical protein n=1 Tax=Tetraodon nigroviridis TaxID=99883 RepID=Q4SDM5_TETNG|nr:unnamed protein product [Tetraodon nigroviridis]